MTIKFSAELVPIPFSRPRFNSDKKGVFNQSRYTAFKNALGLIARRAMDGRKPFAGEVKVTAEFYKPKPRPRKGHKQQVSFSGDVDNFLKSIMDALNGICYEDDRQVIEVHAKKIFGEPHIEIQLEAIT